MNIIKCKEHYFDHISRVYSKRNLAINHTDISSYFDLYLASFGFTALLVKCLCWAFGYAFSWKIAFGIWILLALVGRAFKSNVTVKK